MDEEADDVTDEPINPRDEIEPRLEVLLDRAATNIGRYVAMTAEQRDAVALWVAHCHAIDATSTTPYLYITSAVEESGKTRLLETLSMLVPRGMMSTSLTAAVMFRVIEQEYPTLLIDEADNTLTAVMPEPASKPAYVQHAVREAHEHRGTVT